VALLVLLILGVSPVYGSSITIPYTFTPNTTIVAAQVNANFSTIASVVNGNLDNSNLSAGASISLSKLNLTQSLLNLQSTGTTLAIGAGQVGDTVERVGMLGNGQLVFGAGSANPIDVGFTRTGAGVLQLNNGSTGTATFDMNGGTIINTAAPLPDVQGLRITTSSTLPVAPDGTSTTIYALPYKSGYIGLYNASNVWVTDVVTSLSIAMPATTATAYDVYVYDNAGVATIGLAVWSGSTPPTRGNQNGVPFTNNSKYDRWIGSVATNGTSGTTEDDASARYVWNYNNQLPRVLFAQVPVSSWTYATSTIRASDGNSTLGQGRAGVLIGLANSVVDATFVCATNPGTNESQSGIGVNSTTAFYNSNFVVNDDLSVPGAITTRATAVLSQGINYIQMLENESGGTVTFYGTAGATSGTSWLQGITIQ
jgi:hypothetical protein